LFYEYNANETNDENNVLLHCLGHWRIMESFHDLVFHPVIQRIGVQLLDEKPIRFWHDQLFCVRIFIKINRNLQKLVDLLHFTKIIHSI
jgi:hypothetical protein